MTFWTKAAGKAESIFPEAKRGNDGDGKMEEARGGRHLAPRSTSFAWFILSEAPTMQMTHKVEIERLCSRCQE